MTQSNRPPGPLKRAIFESGVVQRELAAAIGIHESTLSRIVKGMDPGEATAQALARELRQTPTALGWPHYDPESRAA